MSGQYLGDFIGDEVLPILFDTFGSSGESVSLAGLALTDIQVYRITQASPGYITDLRSSSSGYFLIDTDGVDIGQTSPEVAGIHGFTIDLSDNTDAGFFSAGNDYWAVVNAVLIGSPQQTVRFIAARFSIQNRFPVGQTLSANVVQISGDTTAADNLELQYDGTGLTGENYPSTQAQVGAIGTGAGGGFRFEAQSDNSGSPVIKGVPFVGSFASPGGSFAFTEAEDGNYTSILHSGNTIDYVVQFSVGGDRRATEFTFKGYLTGANDVCLVQAYDFVGADWETRATISGQAGTTNVTVTGALLSKHTGATGTDIGFVILRFLASAQTSPELYIDELLVEASGIGQSIGYANGSIWVDTNNGVSGTEAFVNGVADNPVLTWANALSLSTTTNIQRFTLISGSSITLTGSVATYYFDAIEATIALGGQNIAGAFINGATVSGIATGNDARLIDCRMGTLTLAPFGAGRCAITGTITAGSAGTFILEQCFSGVAGGGTPIFDFALLGGSNVNFRHYSGGVELQNMSAGDTCSVEGNGQVVVNANCTGGELVIRGNFKLTDNSSGAVSVVYSSPLADQVQQGTAQSATANTVTLAATASAVDGQYDPGKITIVTGTGAGQTRSIIDYNGTTKVAVIDRDWRVNPDTTSSYVIFSSSGELHVNEGLAQAGTSTTITLNAAASATDDIYNGQCIFLTGGTGQDQSRIIEDYNGTTKVATVSSAFDVTPTSTTSYVMLPIPQAYGISNIVWDEVLTAATHNVATSAGRRLRQVTSTIVHSGTAQGPGTGTNQIQLDTGASAVDGSYDPGIVAITNGTGIGQSRLILQYEGSTRTATVDRDWKVNPFTDSEFIISAFSGGEHVNEGLAQAGASTTITLNTLASAVDDVYIGQLVFIRSGTGADQSKLIIDYNGTTKVATIDGTWETVPDTTSAYVMLPSSPSLLASATQASIDSIETDVASVLVDTGTTLPGLLQEQGIQKNAIFSNFEFVMVLASDGQTPATGLTVTGQRSVDGGAFVSVGGTIAEVSNGVYQFDAAAADTNGDVITWRFSSATALDRFVTFKTVQ